ncbi:hypothetical protein B0H63DRAFT_487440 [Podospora didyma]|uniref:Uncharacterized protein n=1 Tax=Podospora didyma TaxID=330526 RepID=A0AAE0N5Z5_9PEZI|nr:hypothetical protein B0H63DRAFT_487440 [Podospora didyma]
MPAVVREYQDQDEVLALIYDIQKASRMSNWSPAVRAAPEAIVIMAVCLSAASHPDAQAIEIGKGWTDLDGGEIKFPSKFLNTNLQHCTDLGRAAFRTAETGMRQLQLNLEDILGSHGTIRGIARLLDRPKAARFQLRPKMDSLRDSAADCLKNANNIRDRFDKLLAFTSALYKATEDAQGATTQQEAANKKGMTQQESDIKTYEMELADIRAQQTKDTALLNLALLALDEAEKEVKTANAAVLVTPKMMTADELKAVVGMSAPLPPSGDGVFQTIGNYIGGKSEKRRKKEAAAMIEHGERIAKRQDQLLKVQQQNAEEYRKNAQTTLDKARADVKAKQEVLDRTLVAGKETAEKLRSASRSLDTANHMLEQLQEEKMDLGKAKKIIGTSLDSLMRFKQQIDDMLAYFTENAVIVQQMIAPRGHLGQLLEQIEGVSMGGGNTKGARVIENFKFEDEDREDFLQHALQLEGRFSGIYEIAGIYLEISKKYIIPGINQMEELSIMSERQYGSSLLRFQQWIADAKQDIEAMSSERREREITRTIGMNMWQMATGAKMIANSPFPDGGTGTGAIEANGSDDDEE